MRVTDGVRERPAGDATRGRGSFADSLRARRAALAAPAQPGEPGRSAGARRKAGEARKGAPEERRAASREEERAVAAGAPAFDPGCPGEAASAPELRAAVRALPVAIQAARLREGEPLALSLGRSLDVEIRAGAAGVELALRPEPRLARAAEAELPALVAALRERGIAVARADVRARGDARGRPRPR